MRAITRDVTVTRHRPHAFRYKKPVFSAVRHTDTHTHRKSYRAQLASKNQFSECVHTDEIGTNIFIHLKYFSEKCLHTIKFCNIITSSDKHMQYYMIIHLHFISHCKVNFLYKTHTSTVRITITYSSVL